MRRTIVLVGNSPFIYFVARFLNTTLARHVENNVIWLTSETHLPDLVGSAAWATPGLPVKTGTEHIRIIRSEIKQITLSEKRIITTKGVINYQLLVVDEQARYRQSELVAMHKAVNDLLLTLQAERNNQAATTARIICKGDSAESLQLAARLSDMVQSFPGLVRRLTVETEVTSAATEAFRRANNLKGVRQRSVDHTLTLEAPTALLRLAAMKGLRVGPKGAALVDSSFQSLQQPGVFVLDGPIRAWQNIWQTERVMAKRFVATLARALDNQPLLPVESAAKATLLTSSSAVLVELGGMVSSRSRARVVLALERRLRRQLEH